MGADLPRPMQKGLVFGALLPLWTGLVLALLAPQFYEAMFLNPPGFLGLPAGLALLLGGAILTALGFVAIADSRRPARSALAFALLTLPATAIILLWPAVILIVLNLST